jgi:XRE family transcriptional regulator, regulator of sulfur utilization
LDNLSLTIGNNLKQIRDKKKLSLDKVAELTGVSKSMLGQIERGESNPTITTVCKIAKGLRVSFTELISTPRSEVVLIKKCDIQPMVEDEGKYKLYPFFPYEDNRRFEIFSVDIESGGNLSAVGHGDGTEEFITVFQGQLSIKINEEIYIVNKGDSIRFNSDKPHEYKNTGNELATINMIIYYPS